MWTRSSQKSSSFLCLAVQKGNSWACITRFLIEKLSLLLQSYHLLNLSRKGWPRWSSILFFFTGLILQRNWNLLKSRWSAVGPQLMHMIVFWSLPATEQLLVSLFAEPQPLFEFKEGVTARLKRKSLFCSQDRIPKLVWFKHFAQTSCGFS